MHVFVVWIHVVAAVVWFGGVLFMVMVMVPAARGVLDPPMRSRFMAQIGRRFRNVTWASAAILIVTGILNITMRVGGQDIQDIRFFMRVLTVKFLLVVVILAITALHDFVLAPRLTPRPGEPPPDQAILRQRMIRLSWLPRISVVLGLVVMLLGLVLSRH